MLYFGSASRTTTVYKDRQLRMSWVCHECVCECVMSVCVSVHRNRSGGSRNQTVTCADAAADCFDLKSGQTMMRFQNHEVDTVTHFHHWRCRRCSTRHNKLTRRTWGGPPLSQHCCKVSDTVEYSVWLDKEEFSVHLKPINWFENWIEKREL